MRISSTTTLPLFRAMFWGVFLVGVGLLALRLRSYSRLPTVPIEMTANAQETTCTFESFSLAVPHSEDVVERDSNHGEDRLRVISQVGSMEVVVRGIHGPRIDKEDREWQADHFCSDTKTPFQRSETVFEGKPAIKLHRQGRFVSFLGRSDGQIDNMDETATIVAWRGHILAIAVSFCRGDSKARSEADRLISHLKLRDTE
ncbi:MAG: hypothetical protein JWL77_6230 [Chthonomonadaceae bacterium]|nr:hypothetical protein [Chthonomonadaceae bacterium]